MKKDQRPTSHEKDVSMLRFGVHNAIALTADVTGLRAGPVSEKLVDAIVYELVQLGYGCRQ